MMQSDLNKMLTFWSRSKHTDHRYLSNFELIPGGMRIPDDFFIIYMQNRTFQSIENAFQACKYAFSDNPTLMTMLETCSPKEAKSAGSKTGMKKRKTTLDISVWNGVSFECMSELLHLRYQMDQRFAKIVDDSKRDGKIFYHLEIRGPKIWGGYMKDGEWIGQNKLGHILNTLVE